MSNDLSSTNEARLLREVAHRWVRAGWQHPDLSAFEQLHAPEFTDHSSSGRAPTRIGFWQGVLALYAAFPDFHATVEDLVVEQQTGKVSICWAATGTHQGVFLGVEPTNRQVRFEGIEIVRVQSGRIMERWGEWNGLEVLQQLQGVS